MELLARSDLDCDEFVVEARSEINESIRLASTKQHCGPSGLPIESKVFNTRQAVGSVLQNQREVSSTSLVGSTPTRFRQFLFRVSSFGFRVFASVSGLGFEFF